jgi:hypothetical protein
MAKFKIVSRQYELLTENPGKPLGDSVVRIIDTKTSQKYDGATTVDEVKEIFLATCLHHPLHLLEVRVESIEQLE